MTGQGTEFREDFAVYNKTAKQYDEIRFTGQAGQWSHNRQMEVLLQLLPDLDAKKVLEIGAGTGRVTHSLAQAGAQVTATDISAEMLEVAKQRLSEAGLGHTAQFRQLNIFDPGTDFGGYDYIVALNVLSRLSEPQAAITNVAKSMSPTCRFVFSFNCLASVLLPFALLVNARGKSLSRNVTSRWYTPAHISRFCSKAGLTVQAWHGNHYVPAPRLLHWSLPLFKLLDRGISTRFPRLSPSVFAVTGRA